MHRYELTDAEWQLLAPFFPERYPRTAGHPWHGHRTIVNGILWHLHTGAPWPDLPERYGPWQTVYSRFRRWRDDGLWATILDTLLLRLDRAGLIDRDLWLVDASIIRASRAAAGAEKKSGHRAEVGQSGRVANPRAFGPCARPLPRGLRHEAPSGLRQPRHRAGGLGDPWPAPRIASLQHRAPSSETAPLGGTTALAPTCRRRQGI
jgi:transposase